jgi:hypothetical protein
LRVPWLPTFFEFFKMTISNQLPNGSRSPCEMDARDKTGIPRTDEKLSAAGLGAMPPHCKENSLVRQAVVRKFCVPCPPHPLLGGGFEPRFAFATFNADSEFASILLRRASQPNTSAGVFRNPCVKGRFHNLRGNSLLDPLSVKGDRLPKFQQTSVSLRHFTIALRGVRMVTAKPCP